MPTFGHWMPMRIIAIAKVLSTAALTAVTVAAVLIQRAPVVSADDCADVEVVFARGTSEPVGVGGVGQQFVDAVRAQKPDKSIDVYAVNYLASNDFKDPMEFARSVVDGIRDAGNHVMSTAANCPSTRIVLGGYSQGAVVSGFTTAAAVPPGVPADLVPAPMPAAVADHVAAVALFGMPSAAWMQSYGAPPVTIGPLYAAKTIQLCSPGDGVCDGDAVGRPGVAHLMYGMNGMVAQAATFVADRL